MVPFTRTLAASPLLLAGLGAHNLNTVVNFVLALLVAIDVHELGHAVVADRMGDDTPRVMGHLSLNPFRHMNQLGIVLLFVSALSVANGGQAFTFGFTPVNEAVLRRRTPFGPAIVALAGPVMNLVLAALVAIPLTHAASLDAGYNWVIAGNTQVFDFLFALFSINVFLAVFNLVPLPPLDGWTILAAFLAPRTVFNLRPLIQYGPMILLLLILFEPQVHFFSSVIYPMTDWVSTQLLRL